MSSESAQAALDALDAVLSDNSRLRMQMLAHDAGYRPAPGNEPWPDGGFWPPIELILIPWCRWSEGWDLLIGKRSDQAECICCPFVADGKGTYVSDSSAEFAAHLRRHRNAKHAMPKGVIDTVLATWNQEKR